MRTGSRTLARARRLRREMSPPEVRLWLRLKALGPEQPRFRRQHPFGPYILDFYCPSSRLVVEVDGWGHNMGDQPVRDLRRDEWLRDQGLTVVRLHAADVMREPDEVVHNLLIQAAACVSPPPSASRPPPPLRGGGE